MAQTTISTLTTPNLNGSTSVPPSKPAPATPIPPNADGLLDTTDGQVLLVLLILLLALVVAVPIVAYWLGKKYCWIRVHDPERGKWQTDKMPNPAEDNSKAVQTEVLGLEFDEFFRRRQPIDMSKYEGKQLGVVEEPYPRFYRIHPKEFNDVWSNKYAGNETNYITKVW
ncbi:uncharacterized protein LOC127858930 [Dreissena polymorpha]|uniref:Uncharacterized protein n=1 Tax=Dreissena polymorpha TaxID=45954 RepID=A0A9D3Z1S4_DREPO|nr:uncharacterized protein LOC127858930 [Dreissena polymorpha]KAH3710124.1 hypothetical protein DPMN_069591 [Dreissena polymorpha]